MAFVRSFSAHILGVCVLICVNSIRDGSKRHLNIQNEFAQNIHFRVKTKAMIHAIAEQIGQQTIPWNKQLQELRSI